MIRQTIKQSEYDWTVYAYYAVDTYYVSEIADRLADLGCDADYQRRASDLMMRRTLNNGLTYSNLDIGETVLVVGLASSPAQHLNSLVHELQHLVSHICEARGVAMQTEEACYLAGSLAEEIYPSISELLT